MQRRPTRSTQSRSSAASDVYKRQIIDLLLNNDKYDVWFSLDMEKIKYLCFEFPYRNKIIEDWKKIGYRFTNATKDFDIVISGDTLRNAKDYGKTLLIFLNHGTGIKNILYRNLARSPGVKYQIFVEGQPVSYTHLTLPTIYSV